MIDAAGSLKGRLAASCQNETYSQRYGEFCCTRVTNIDHVDDDGWFILMLFNTRHSWAAVRHSAATCALLSFLLLPIQCCHSGMSQGDKWLPTKTVRSATPKAVHEHAEGLPHAEHAEHATPISNQDGDCGGHNGGGCKRIDCPSLVAAAVLSPTLELDRFPDHTTWFVNPNAGNATAQASVPTATKARVRPPPGIHRRSPRLYISHLSLLN